MALGWGSSYASPEQKVLTAPTVVTCVVTSLDCYFLEGIYGVLLKVVYGGCQCLRGPKGSQYGRVIPPASRVLHFLQVEFSKRTNSD